MNRIPYKTFEDFSEVKEKDCLEADKQNDIIYKQTSKTVAGAITKINKSGISVSIEVPKPPSPNNYQKYILWKKRTVKKHVIYQSQAIEYLCNQNYKLDEDYEAYQAIDVANWIKSLNNDNNFILSGEPVTEENENILTSNIFRKYKDSNPNIRRRNNNRNTIRRDTMENNSFYPDLNDLDKPPQYLSTGLVPINNRISSAPSAPPPPPIPMPTNNNISTTISTQSPSMTSNNIEPTTPSMTSNNRPPSVPPPPPPNTSNEENNINESENEEDLNV